MINVVPQPQYDRAWQGLKGDLNAFVRNPGTPRNEVYVIAGRFGASDHIPSQPRTNYNGETYQFNIDVPEYLWKVVLIPESSGKNPTDITPNDVPFGVILPNTDPTKMEKFCFLSQRY
ncbi:hypothetical protein [Kamptonema formosum]|uniref:hypothetical protein n=1 Tax=Kamptonema formosum TaxID=331992 RepID=UPI00037072E7